MLGINSSRPHRYSVDSEDNVVTEEIEEDFEKNDSDSESDLNASNDGIQEHINLRDSVENLVSQRSPTTPPSAGTSPLNTAKQKLELESGLKKQGFVTQGARQTKPRVTSASRTNSINTMQSHTDAMSRQYRSSPVPSPHHSNAPITIGTGRITSRSPSPSISTMSPNTPTSGGIHRPGAQFPQSPSVKYQNTMMSITSQTQIQSPSNKSQPQTYVKRQPSPMQESPRTPRTPRSMSVMGTQSPTTLHKPHTGEPIISPRVRSNSGGPTTKPPHPIVQQHSQPQMQAPQQLHVQPHVVPQHIEENDPGPPMPKPRRRRTVQIKNYRKGDLIGQGANGRVYLSYNMDFGSLFVIKEITFANVPPNVLEERLVALQREINVMKSLEHENIVQYYGAEKVGTTLNIFLEYIAGGSVASLVKRYGHLSEEVIRSYTKQILTGLQYLHQNMIVHRDIKGANILVNVEGVLKLADFGASRQIQDIMTLSCEFKSLMGTPHFMAPEVIMQTGHGRSADIWSVACTVLEMFTGKPPFSEYTTAAAVMFHIASSNDMPFYSDNISLEARDFLDKCFIRDQTKRWTAAELLNHPWLRDIESPFEPEETQITPPTPSRQNIENVQRSSTPEHIASRLRQAKQEIVEDEEFMMDNNTDQELIELNGKEPSEPFEKQQYQPIQPKEGFDSAKSINKFLKQRSVWQSRSIKENDMKSFLAASKKHQQEEKSGTRSRGSSASSVSSGYSVVDDEDDIFPIRDGTESPRELNSPRQRKSPLSSPKNKSNLPPHAPVTHTFSGRRNEPIIPPPKPHEEIQSLAVQGHHQQAQQYQSLQPSSNIDKPINTMYTDLYLKKKNEKVTREMKQQQEFEEEQRRYLEQNMRELLEKKIDVDLSVDDGSKPRAHTAPSVKRATTAELQQSQIHRDKDVDDLAPLGSRGKKQPGTPNSRVNLPHQIVTKVSNVRGDSASGSRSPVIPRGLKSPKSGTPVKTPVRNGSTPVRNNVK